MQTIFLLSEKIKTVTNTNIPSEYQNLNFKTAILSSVYDNLNSNKYSFSFKYQNI
jgi:hypothetical protein